MIPRLRPQPKRRDAPPQEERVFGAVFRRFFDLIERLERPGLPAPRAPEVKARITRLDDDPPRNV